MTEGSSVRQFFAGVPQGRWGAGEVTAGGEGCPGDRWPDPPGGSSPAGPASAWWWCHLSGPGRRWCLWAGRGGTAAELLWLCTRTKHRSGTDTLEKSDSLPAHMYTPIHVFTQSPSSLWVADMTTLLWMIKSCLLEILLCLPIPFKSHCGQRCKSMKMIYIGLFYEWMYHICQV